MPNLAHQSQNSIVIRIVPETLRTFGINGVKPIRISRTTKNGRGGGISVPWPLTELTAGLKFLLNGQDMMDTSCRYSVWPKVLR